MADAQFVVYNDAGVEQVNLGGGINLALVSKLVIPRGSWSGVAGPRSSGLKYSFATSAVSPIIAVSTDATGPAGAVYPIVSGGNITLYGGASTPTSGTGGAPTLTATTTVYVFDAAPAPPAGSGQQGLVLYRADGTCAFNSNYPAARVRQMIDDGGNLHGYGTSLTPPAGKTYAWVLRSSYGQMLVESYNSSTGDKLVFDWRAGCSGGAAGASIRIDDGFGGGNVTAIGSGYPCMIDGGVSTRAGVSGIAQLWLKHGCNNGSQYFADAMILDVTNL